MNVDRLFESLLAELEEAIDLLGTGNESHWQAWLQTGRDQVANGDAHGLDHLLRAFGGMGSLNDVVLRRQNQAGQLEYAREADLRLSELRESIWHLCRELKRGLAE